MATPRQKGFRVFLIFLAVLTCFVAAAIWLSGWDDPLASRRNPETEDAYADGEYTPIAAREEGYLRRIEVDDNQLVRAGQVIAELEDDDYKAQVTEAEGELHAAQAVLQQLRDQQNVLLLQVRQSEHQTSGSAAEQVRAAQEAARQAALLPTAAGLRRQYDNAVAEDRRLAANTRAQSAQTLERRRQVAVLAAQQDRAAADIELQQAQLDLARIRLSYTAIRAPADGVVGTRQVRVGTLLEPGSVVVPITPLQHVWITANFTEDQLARIHPGQPARVRMDAYPDVELWAHVAGISPLTGGQLTSVPADNVTGNYTKVVQRVPVKIVIDTSEPRLRGQLRPGMSALARVLTDGDPQVRPAR